MTNQRKRLLSVKGIKKSFSNNHVLKGIDLDVYPGEVHVLLGENGAGKSTLIKILTGAYQKGAGEVYWEDQLVKINTPQDSMELGIATIYQELNVVPQLKVYENIFLGRELKNGSRRSMLNQKEMRKKAGEYLEQLGQNRDLADRPLEELGIGQQQLVEIAKALTIDAKLIIMDEPTASLSGAEVEQLYSTVESLTKKGIAIVFISHRLDEIKRMGDRITILRDGFKIETLDVSKTSTDYWIELMVGRSLDEKYPKKSFALGKEGFRVENLLVDGTKEPVNFQVNYGEIVGVSGLVGAGRTEMARAIFGADAHHGGEIFIDGQLVKIKSPKDAIKAGIAFITEDRKNEGLLLDQPLDFNIALANMKMFRNSMQLVDLKNIRTKAEEYIKELKVRPSDVELNARKLSGGNQQKVVIAKWLCTEAKVFIFDEPTRGIDVGAKVEVYRLMNQLVENGAVVLMISSDLPEIIGMCDRVLVMSEGRITANLPIGHATQERIMKAATANEDSASEVMKAATGG
ncbi:sugar ABC transporter ATP-binding protein [Domibacillus enclensis]|uniref:D-xylose ABC transporter ATP-binding protein n=1 Tax=Domibacillus enclensis TaxID=1017273 RepID=A0A1N6VBM2_9BACI|nr:sugar ABC transporter ATP-binding protein [Domibacillus enclensis]OXS78742.1 D-xylose ABC transporter ATP-binding protein [Domibacillus enclensis]SIQ75129.1 ribose transport system ATP-binding protein [Domibacillus enclensis]